jgi:hypothetical protein
MSGRAAKQVLQLENGQRLRACDAVDVFREEIANETDDIANMLPKRVPRARPPSSSCAPCASAERLRRF